MKLKRYQSGFTLIELLVIISIIGFLVAAISLVLSSSRSKSRNAKRVADIKQINAALDLYYSRCNSYPINPGGVVIDSIRGLHTGTSVTCGTHTGSSNVNGGLLDITTITPGGTIIVAKFPSAPLPVDGSCTDAVSSNRYTYTSAAGTGYTLTFCLGAATGGYGANVNTITR
jgi:prepilin-type N-terminal cleavage/methylation domain-containing protein